MNKIALARKLAALTEEDRKETIAFSKELASRGGPVTKKKRKYTKKKVAKKKATKRRGRPAAAPDEPSPPAFE